MPYYAPLLEENSFEELDQTVQPQVLDFIQPAAILPDQNMALNPTLKDFRPAQYMPGTSITGWLKTLDDYFAITNIGDQHKLNILRVLLNPELRDWIDELPEDVDTYPLVRKATIAHVTGTDDEYTARANFKSATRKKNETIEQYKTRLLRFGEILGHTPDSMAIRDKILETLPEDIAQTISIATGRGPLKDVIERIKMYEGQQKSKTSSSSSQQQQVFQTQSDSDTVAMIKELEQEQRAYSMNSSQLCYKCNKPGHFARECMQHNGLNNQDNRIRQLEQKLLEMENKTSDIFKDFTSGIKDSLDRIERNNRGRSSSRFSSRRRDDSRYRSQSRDRRSQSRGRRSRDNRDNRDQSNSRSNRSYSRSDSNRRSYNSAQKAASHRSTSRNRDKNRNNRQ